MINTEAIPTNKIRDLAKEIVNAVYAPGPYIADYRELVRTTCDLKRRLKKGVHEKTGEPLKPKTKGNYRAKLSSNTKTMKMCKTALQLLNKCNVLREYRQSTPSVPGLRIAMFMSNLKRVAMRKKGKLERLYVAIKEALERDPRLKKPVTRDTLKKLSVDQIEEIHERYEACWAQRFQKGDDFAQKVENATQLLISHFNNYFEAPIYYKESKHTYVDVMISVNGHKQKVSGELIDGCFIKDLDLYAILHSLKDLNAAAGKILD